LALAPGQVLGDQLVDVGVDGEMLGRVEAADQGEKYRDAKDLLGIAGTAVNGADNRLLQHGCPGSNASEADRGPRGTYPMWRRNIRQFRALTTTKVALENPGLRPIVPSTTPGPRARFKQRTAGIPSAIHQIPAFW